MSDTVRQAAVVVLHGGVLPDQHDRVGRPEVVKFLEYDPVVDPGK